MEKKLSPPKKLKIKGQPHKLAYINDVEEGLLRARGGSGEMVHGIPAFYDEGDDYTGQGGNDSTNDFGLSDDFGGNDGNTNDYISSQIQQANKVVEAQQALEDSLRRERAQMPPNQRMINTARNPYANSGLTAQDRAFNTISNAQRVAQSYFNNPSVFAPSVYSSRKVGQDLGNLLKLSTYKNALAGKGFNLGGTSLYSNYFDDPTFRGEFSNMAVNQLNDRVAGYNSATSPFGKIAGAANAYGANNIIKALENGGRPVLDAQGNVKGAFNDSFLGEVYTGMPVEGVDGTGFGNQGGNDGAEIKEPNPLTGQCDEGYFFDEDLQACRMGSAAASDETVAPVTAPATGAYYRPTGLETASAFTPAGFDYDAANSAFLDSYAYRPENYQDPMSLNGFKQIT